MMKSKFRVEPYFCESIILDQSMNDFYKRGYYPKEIKLQPYQDKVEGFIIYELIGGNQ